MVSVSNITRRLTRFLMVLLVPVVLVGCGFFNFNTGGPRVNRNVQVAMLLPVTSDRGGDSVIARSLENAARMAATQHEGLTIDIRVYDTAGQAEQAASVARQAVREGADVIIGPLRSDAAAAVGVAISGAQVNVLTFSNNTEIAGGNVFVLGHTFANTANRIISYGVARGRDQIVITHAENLAGQVARDAVQDAARRYGANVLGAIGYEFSQISVVNVVPEIVELIEDSRADSLMLTSDSAGALPFFAQLLPENGLDTSRVQMMGITRWDTPPQTLAFEGLQNGWFAIPDPSATASFNARYSSSFGGTPHVLAALGYDAIQMIAETSQTAGRLSAEDFASIPGVNGANGVFRLLPDGTNQRGMAIAQVVDEDMQIIDPAPRSLGGPGL
jgi:ABC-type branched-subunit amino acid transport system substrate-binding protein